MTTQNGKTVTNTKAWPLNRLIQVRRRAQSLPASARHCEQTHRATATVSHTRWTSSSVLGSLNSHQKPTGKRRVPGWQHGSVDTGPVSQATWRGKHWPGEHPTTASEHWRCGHWEPVIRSSPYEGGVHRLQKPWIIKTRQHSLEQEVKNFT